MQTRQPALLWLCLIWILTGCAWVQSPAVLPTLQPTAPPIEIIPIVYPTAQPIPPTFTPPGQSPNTTASAGITVTLTPLETFLQPSPTPLLATADEQIPEPLPTPFADNLPAFSLSSRTGCQEDGVLFRSQFPSEVGGPRRGYHGYLPPCYGKDGRSYPTLYLFHGSIQDDTHWIDLGLIGYVEAGIKAGRLPPFIIIMPNNGEIGNNTSGNTHSVEGITVDALIPHIDNTFCTWPTAAGRGIGGISRGGYWALMIAFRHEELFTAVSGHSSHLRYETDRAEYNPLSTYADADLSNLRIWLDWGETGFLRAGQAQLRDALQAIDANVTASVNPGGHNDDYWREHIQAYVAWHTADWSSNRFNYPPCSQSTLTR